MAYHTACNFGANLQLLSTYEFLKNHGHEPIIINWVSLELENYYSQGIPKIQYNVHLEFRKKYYKESNLCRNAKDVAEVIKTMGIEAVIIGSDAIAQHHVFLSRIGFPTRSIITINHHTEDRRFPNPFWGTFNDYLDMPVKIAVISASCQNSNYKLYSSSLKTRMMKYVGNYSYLSVRDDWTRKLYECISEGKLHPDVTPDPVFAFNNNVSTVPLREEIKKKFDLPDKYILLSFLNQNRMNAEWIKKFKILANKDGYTTVALTYPKHILFGDVTDMKIEVILSPIDWFAIIKYSSGYVGHNMHPIVVSLHNNVPFYSFDNYGITKMGYFVNEKSSKIYHILTRAGFLDQRCNDRNLFVKLPGVDDVYGKIVNFDREKCMAFSQEYYKEYEAMMNAVLESFN